MSTPRIVPALALSLSALIATPLGVAAASESDEVPASPAPSRVFAGAPSRTSAGIAAGAAGLALAAVPGRTALSPGAFQAAVARALSAGARSRYLGTRLSGTVMDAASGTVLWNHYSYVKRMPASTQKVMTAFTVLRSMSPDQQLVTRLSKSTAIRTNVYLTGAGDPSLTLARLKSLALRSARSLKAGGTKAVNLYVDDTIFPAATAATGWKASYLRADVQRVRGLTLAGYRGSDGTIAAGNYFAGYLKAYGVPATLRGRAVTPSRRTELAASWSAPVRSMVRTMLAYSVNDYAEYLLRHAARSQGVYPNWNGAIRNQVAKLSAARISTVGYRGYDGSGLSRANRMPVRTLAETLRAMWINNSDREVAFAWSGMPRAGQTGTLRSRFQVKTQGCARGKVIAKTGTLGDAVGLAGVAQGSDGRDRVFVLLENGLTNANSVRLAMDQLATSVVGCRLG